MQQRQPLFSRRECDDDDVHRRRAAMMTDPYEVTLHGKHLAPRIVDRRAQVGELAAAAEPHGLIVRVLATRGCGGASWPRFACGGWTW